MPTTIRLSKETEQRISTLAKKTGRTQSYYLRQLIEDGLDHLEFEQGILTTAADIRAGKRETMSADDVRAGLGLGD